MTGIEIFIGGGILICNAVLATYLITSNKVRENRSNKESDPKPYDVESAEKPKEHLEQGSKTRPVAESKFNADEFFARYADEFIKNVKKKLPALIAAIGDVNKSDVEFSEENAEDNNQKFVPAKEYKPLSAEELEAAFDTDIRDVEDLPPSAPVTTGTTFDELEKAVNTAMDVNSTDEDLAEAGRVIAPFTMTQLYGAITTDEEISDRVDLCLRLSIQADLNIKPKNSRADKKNSQKQEPQQANTKTKEEKKESLVDFNNIDIDTFDIADLLKRR